LFSEQYRKESSYLEVNEENTERPKVPKVEKIRELSEKLSSASSSSSSTLSSTSSRASVVIRSKVDEEKPTQEKERPTQEKERPTQEKEKPKQEKERQTQEKERPKQEDDKQREPHRVRLDSTSSSSSNDTEYLSESDLPKYAPRKSSFSSPSEMDTDHGQLSNKVFEENQNLNKNVVVFGEEPGESVDTDVEKVRKPIRTKLSESADSDSDSSASEASFHIEHPEIFAKSVKPVKELSRTETLESSDLSEAETQKQHRPIDSESEQDTRYEMSSNV
jgi:hypothetical protein